ncbi:MAG: hypothetical protein IJD77_00305 [Clostridia bacterium]|nr:hypothetical protein [Clostridia bacterium]
MKNIFKRTMALLLALSAMFTVASCGRGEIDIGDPALNEDIDPDRTQLFVYSYTAGYGSDWIISVKEKFEELHKDDTNWETGKTGVQVVLDAKKNDIMGKAESIPGEDNEVFFAESAYYYTLKAKGVLGDITDAVTTEIPNDNGKTIYDKMTEGQRKSFGIEENGKTHYYGIPHNNTFTGIIYNKDLFDKKQFYFAKEPVGTGLQDLFVLSETEQRSYGPDGRTGVVDGVDYSLDDGLPATYEEFFTLMEYMYQNNVTPIAWNGYRYFSYLNWMVQAFVSDYEGYDQMMLNFNLNGEATDLGTVDKNGEFVKDAQTTQIGQDKDSVVALSRQAGKYYALQFIDRLTEYAQNKDKEYVKSGMYDSGYMHTAAQYDFIVGSANGVNKDIGMLIEGIWWEAEAKNDLVYAESLGIKDPKFALMPLPNATEEKLASRTAGEKSALYDQLFGLTFMKSNVADWKKPLALDFIKFCHSDTMLKDYTLNTGAPKAFNYEMTETELSQLTYFGRSVWNAKATSDIIYPYAQNERYINNQSRFSTFDMYYSTTSSTYRWIADGMKAGVSAADYFKGLATYNKNYTWL